MINTCLIRKKGMKGRRNRGNERRLAFVNTCDCGKEITVGVSIESFCPECKEKVLAHNKKIMESQGLKPRHEYEMSKPKRG